MSKPLHEPQQIRVGPLAGVLAGVVLVLGFSLVVLYFFYQGKVQPVQERSVGQDSLISQKDSGQLQEEKMAYLTTYGWVDADRNIAHIPIDQAIGLVLERYSLQPSEDISDDARQESP